MSQGLYLTLVFGLLFLMWIGDRMDAHQKHKQRMAELDKMNNQQDPFKIRKL